MSPRSKLKAKRRKTRQNDSWTGGLILIIIGLLFIANNYYGWGMLWPLVLMIPITAIIIDYAKNKDHSNLIPITILSIIMLLFLAMTTGVLSWGDLSWLWPAFILAPGLGILLSYLANGMKEHELLIPTSILIGLAAIFMLGAWPYWPIILIIIGATVIIKSTKK